jgi:hypothetical protein
MATWTEVVISIVVAFSVTTKTHPLKIRMFFLKRLFIIFML